MLECLQKALKIADTCMETEINLFVEILRQYLYYFINDNEAVSRKHTHDVSLLLTSSDHRQIFEWPDCFN